MNTTRWAAALILLPAAAGSAGANAVAAKLGDGSVVWVGGGGNTLDRRDVVRDYAVDLVVFTAGALALIWGAYSRRFLIRYVVAPIVAVVGMCGGVTSFFVPPARPFEVVTPLSRTTLITGLVLSVAVVVGSFFLMRRKSGAITPAELDH